MGEVTFGEIRVYLTTTLCIKINNGNGKTNEYITIEPGNVGYIDFQVKNTCTEEVEIDLSYREYYGNDITGILITLVDNEKNPLAIPYSVAGNSTCTLKIKIDVDSSIPKNNQYIIRTYFKSVP